MDAIWSLAKKDLTLAWRDKVGAFWRFGFPLILAVFFGFVMAGGGEGMTLEVLLVDEDQSEGSAAFIEELKAAEELEVEVTDRAEAEARVRAGKEPAFVVLPKGFGSSRARPFFGDPATIELGVDPSETAQTAMLEGLLIAHYMEGFSAAMSDTAQMQANTREALAGIESDPTISAADRQTLQGFFGTLGFLLSQIPEMPTEGEGGFQFTPLEFTRRELAAGLEPRTGFDISLPQGMIWSLIGCTLAFAVALVQEREHGTLVRLRMSPLTPERILLGKALACFLTILGTLIALMAIGVLLLGVTLSAPGLFLLAAIGAAGAFVGLMLLIAGVGRTEAAVQGAGWGAMSMLAMIGGGMIPLFIMPPWMQQLSLISPVRWTIVAMEGAIWRGYTLPEMLVPCGVLLGFGLAGFLASRLLVRRALSG